MAQWQRWETPFSLLDLTTSHLPLDQPPKRWEKPSQTFVVVSRYCLLCHCRCPVALGLPFSPPQALVLCSHRTQFLRSSQEALPLARPKTRHSLSKQNRQPASNHQPQTTALCAFDLHPLCRRCLFLRRAHPSSADRLCCCLFEAASRGALPTHHTVCLSRPPRNPLAIAGIFPTLRNPVLGCSLAITNLPVSLHPA